MYREIEWETSSSNSTRLFGSAGIGVLRIALLFGTAAVAFALIIVPIADRETRTNVAQARYPAGVDQTVTGSISYNGRYTIRRSVLQSSPDATCIIRDNGMQIGDC